MAEYMFHILKMNVIAAVMIIVALITARLTKRKYSSKWKYHLWLAVMLFLLVPVNFSSKSPVKIQINPVDSKMCGEDYKEKTEQPAQPVFQAERKKNVVEISSSFFSPYQVLNFLAGIWLMGIVSFTVFRCLCYYHSLHAMRRWSYPVEDIGYLGKYFRVCKAKNIRKPPRLFVCEGLPSPMLAGLRRTGLYIPADDYGEKELEFIFSHELAHYVRHDLWYKMLMLVVITVYWFNPALYLMQREAEKDIENLCDGKMVKHFSRTERIRYGELLLKFAASQSSVPYVSVSFNDSRKILRDRILYMKDLKLLKEKIFPAVFLSIVMVFSHTLVGCSIGELPVKAEGQPKVQTAGNASKLEKQVVPKDAEFMEMIAKSQNAKSNSLNEGADETENPAEEVLSEEDLSGENQTEIEDNEIAYTGNEREDTSLSEETMNPTEDEAGNTGDSDIEFTGQQKKALYIGGNGSEDIYEATDGNWYDDFGRKYVPMGDGYWDLNGFVWFDLELYPEPSPSDRVEEPIIYPKESAVDEASFVDSEGGRQETIYLCEDGTWRTHYNCIWTENGDGTFTSELGEIFYPAQ